MAKFNPATILTYCCLVMLALLYAKSSMSVLLLLIALGLVLTLLGHAKQVKLTLIGGIPFALLFLVFNVILADYGQEVLFYFPLLAGKHPVYVEPVLFGLTSGLKILGMFLTFILLNHYLDAYSLLSLTKGRFPQASLLLALSLRWLPALATLFKKASEFGRTRGLTREQTRKGRIYLDMAKIMFLGSLEQVQDITTALIARGYGTGLRTSYLDQSWRTTDALFLLGLLATSVILWLPHPLRLQEMEESLRFLPFAFLLLMPACIEKGGKKWLY